jgi:DNA-binding transcriptional ArsR family regulator
MTAAGTGTGSGAAGAGDPDLAHVAVAFADPRRVRVLIALADGRALPAGRLAEEAGVAASTVSNHLAILLDHGLVTVTRQGRHRYYRLTIDGADALAKLGLQETVLDTATPLRYCVDWTEQAHHLSGPLGAAVTDQLFELEWITRGVVPRSIQVTAEGEQGIAELLAVAQPEAMAAH